VEFGVLGTAFAARSWGWPSQSGPAEHRRGEGKGNELARAAHEMLAESSLNFVGNVEGRDLLTGWPTSW